jgi:hypothetical protein
VGAKAASKIFRSDKPDCENTSQLQSAESIYGIKSTTWNMPTLQMICRE